MCWGCREDTQHVGHFIKRHKLRVRALERDVRELQQQVRELLMFQAILQHGPGNPVVVDKDEGEEYLEVPVFLGVGEG